MGLVPETKVEILRRIQSEPTHGYALARELELSHGYIYTHLSELQSEDMIEVAEQRDGKKIYKLTTNGEYLLKASTRTSDMTLSAISMVDSDQ